MDVVQDRSGPPDAVTVSAARLADLERVATAASAWLRAWETAQATTKTLVAFESSKQLAAVVRAVGG